MEVIEHWLKFSCCVHVSSTDHSEMFLAIGKPKTDDLKKHINFEFVYAYKAYTPLIGQISHCSVVSLNIS